MARRKLRLPHFISVAFPFSEELFVRPPPPKLPRLVLDIYTNNPRTFLEELAPLRDVGVLRWKVMRNNKVIRDRIIKPKDSKKAWEKQFFEGTSSEDTFIGNDGDRQLVTRAVKVKSSSKAQTFRDSPTSSCVFDMIANELNTRIELAKTPKTKWNYASILNRIPQVQASFPNGVPQEDLQQVADALDICIQLYDVIGNKLLELGASKKRWVVKLTNTRINHVDNYTDDTIIETTKEHIKDILLTLRNNNEFYLIRNNRDEPNFLKTNKGTYIVPNPDTELYAEMNNQLKGSEVDAIKYPDLNGFLRSGTIINSSPMQFSKITEQAKLYDLQRAYTQIHHSPFYHGVLSHIQQFRPLTELQGAGIYEVLLTKLPPAFAPFKNLGYTLNQYIVLPLPDLLQIRKHGGEFKIIAGAIGSTTDLAFPTEMILNKSYQKWCGKLSQPDNYRETSYTFGGTRDHAEILNATYPTTFWETEQEVEVKIPHKRVLTRHHVLAYITSYTRTIVIEELLKLNPASVQAVLLDGIYTTDTITNPLFHEKPIETKRWDYTQLWFADYGTAYPQAIPHAHKTPKPITKNTLLSGQGGSGKTHSILTDKGFHNPLYVVPTLELGKKSGHDNWITIHKLIGQGCSPYHLETIPPVILIDELTMIHKAMIEKAFQMYPSSLILLAGDIDAKRHYQCRNGHPNAFWDIFTDFSNIHIQEFSTDFRALTPELKHQKLKMRKHMEKVYTDGDYADALQMKYYVEETFPTITLQDAIANASESDIFIVGTHKVKAQIPSTFQTHTIHSYQGQTIEPPTKIFITTDFFEYAMPYTALSRARHHDQIYFVST